MKHFLFASCETVDFAAKNTVTEIPDACGVYPSASVAVDDEAQLSLLLEMLGMRCPDPVSMDSPDFDYYLDLTDTVFPVFDEEGFEAFYSNWIETSGRENTMDEYGQLVFLNGISEDLNNSNHRLVFSESS